MKDYKIMNIFFTTVLTLCLVSCGSGTNEQSVCSEDEERIRFVIKGEIDYSLRHGDMDKGIALIKAAERIYKDDASLQYIKGIVYYKQGRNELAEDAFRRAFSLYDSLLERAPSLNYALNKASCLLFIADSAEYNRELDSVCNMEYYRKESPALGEYIDMLRSLSREDVCEGCFRSADSMEIVNSTLPASGYTLN